GDVHLRRRVRAGRRQRTEVDRVTADADDDRRRAAERFHLRAQRVTGRRELTGGAFAQDRDAGRTVHLRAVEAPAADDRDAERVEKAFADGHARDDGGASGTRFDGDAL